MIEQIEVSLQNNENLTDDLKGDLFELILVFQKQFPDIRLKNLNERLKTLRIEKANRFVQPTVLKYLPQQNVLSINTVELMKDHDGKHLMMFALLQMITANGVNTGFDVDHQFEALNNGYTELLANHLVGNSSEHLYYANEFLYANIIGTIVGTEKMQEAYFYNKPTSIIKSLEEAGVNL